MYVVFMFYFTILSYYIVFYSMYSVLQLTHTHTHSAGPDVQMANEHNPGSR